MTTREQAIADAFKGIAIGSHKDTREGIAAVAEAAVVEWELGQEPSDTEIAAALHAYWEGGDASLPSRMGAALVAARDVRLSAPAEPE